MKGKYELMENLLEVYEEPQEQDNSKKLVVYNGSNKSIDFTSIDLNDSCEIGIHCGTLQAAKDKEYKNITELVLSGYKEYKCDFDVTSIWSSIELAKLLGDEELYNSLRTCAGSADKYKEYSKIYRQWFLDKGYSLISYIDEVEDPGSISYIILDTSIIESLRA